MIRFTAAAMLLLVLGAGQASAHDTHLRPVADAAAEAPGERWSAARIARDLVGQSVQIRDVEERQPWSPWTFEADEPKDVSVLDTQLNGASAVVTIDLATHDNMDTGEQTTYVSGRLRLHYERQERGWQLRSIENLSFRASQGGIST